MNWEDELKKFFIEEYESTHPEAKPIYIFKQDMDGLKLLFHSLLKQQREICAKLLEDNSDKILRLITNDENIMSEETFTLLQSDANLSRTLSKLVLNAPEP